MAQNHFNTKDLELLASGLFVDATITCGDRTWKVHKIIVSRCDWFKKAFGGNFEVDHQIHLTVPETSPRMSKELAD